MLRRSDVVAAYLRGRDRQVLLARRARSLANTDRGETVAVDLVIGAADAANGTTLGELQLPRGALVTAVLRAGAMLVPSGQLRLQAGDHVQLVATSETHAEALRKLSGEPVQATVPGNGHRSEQGREWDS